MGDLALVIASSGAWPGVAMPPINVVVPQWPPKIYVKYKNKWIIFSIICD